MALVGSDRAVQPGTLPVGELLLTTAQDRADAVERVVLAATVAVDLLLHTPAVLAAFFEPVALRLARPAGDQVKQPRLRPACVGIRGEVDHPGQLLGSTAAVLDRELADVVPHVLVHTEPFHAGEAPLVVGHRLQQQLDRGSHRVPRRPELLRQAAQTGVINFYGNVEGNDTFKGTTDIVVCDGFVGNVALKTTEGLASMIAGFLREEFSRNLLTKLAALAAMPVLGALKRRIDPRRHNGAALLGLRGLVFKSHGGADEFAFCCAMTRAYDAARHGLLGRVQERITRAAPLLACAAPQPAVTTTN